MTFILDDRIRETSTTTGTGALTLAGAQTGFKTFASRMAAGDTTWYAIVDGTTDWEVGLGTLTTPVSPDVYVLERTTVYRSSNGDAAVNFGAGSKDVFIGLPGITMPVVAGKAQVLTDAQKAQGQANIGLDYDRQNQLLLAIKLSKALAAYQRMINTFADGYKASDGVDATASPDVGSSAYTVNTSSGYVAPQLETSVTISDFDDSNRAWGGTYTLIGRATAVLNGVTITKIGCYNATAATFQVKVVLRNSAGNYTVVVDESFSHPGGGWADKTLSTPYAVPGSGTYYIAGSNPGDANPDGKASAARAYLSGDQTGTSGSYTEDTGPVLALRYTYGASGTGMVVVTTSQTLDASCNRARALVEYEDISPAITLNTDMTLKVSCDGGANYTQGTLVAVGYGQGGRKVAEIEDVTVTAGTSLKAKLETFNSKDIHVYGLAAVARAA